MIAALLFAALLSGEPAAGAQPPPAQASAPAVPAKTAKTDPERICKLEPVLGSKITKKVCYNRAQLEERTFYDKQNLDLIQSQTPMNSH
jgi:hypothetical protein